MGRLNSVGSRLGDSCTESCTAANVKTGVVIPRDCCEGLTSRASAADDEIVGEPSLESANVVHISNKWWSHFLDIRKTIAFESGPVADDKESPRTARVLSPYLTRLFILEARV